MRLFLHQHEALQLRGHHRRHLPLPARAHGVHPPLHRRASTTPQSVHYETPLLKPILDVTYGCMVYQEQVMQIVRDLAGYSPGPQRPGAPRHGQEKARRDGQGAGVSSCTAWWTRTATWSSTGCGAPRRVPSRWPSRSYDEMTAFASYAFNKSPRRGLRPGRRADGLAQAATIPCRSWPRMLNSVMDNCRQGGRLHPVLPAARHPRAAAGREPERMEIQRGRRRQTGHARHPFRPGRREERGAGRGGADRERSAAHGPFHQTSSILPTRA